MFVKTIHAQTIEYGIAAQYPFDEGIKNNSAVIVASGFETENWYYKDLGYTDPYYGGRGYYVYNPNLAYSENGLVEYQNLKGTHSPGPLLIDLPDEYDKVFFRWYRMYEPGFDFSCQVKTNGLYAKIDGASGGGVRPTGYDKYSVRLQIWNREPRLYTYNLDQPGIYGQTLLQNVNGTPMLIEPGQWHSYELMLKANQAGQPNGEIKVWIDGVLKGHYTKLRFRDTNTLKINKFELVAYVGGECTAPKDQKLWDDNAVVATQYIGPMVTGTPPTSTPDPNELIIDNDNGNNNAGGNFTTSSTQSAWIRYQSDAETSQHYLGSHDYNRPGGSGTDVAVWQFTVPTPGQYEVYAWWWDATSGGGVRAYDVPYTINHGAGISTVKVDQRANGKRWNSLGTYDFFDQGSVSITDDIPNQTNFSSIGIVADAIRLIKVGQPVSTASTFCDKADGNEDARVNSLDLVSMFSRWFTPYFDLDFSGRTNGEDAKPMLANWGGCIP